MFASTASLPAGFARPGEPGASDYWQQRVLTETPLHRWGEPRDIANMARFLLSDDAAYITGQVINVNGGAVR
jgi:3-oxoacyl-[acyl-carrier protein] reductase